MFTGIVATVGRITQLSRRGDAMRMAIDSAGLDLSDVALGDSIAVSGPCLTVVEFGARHFAVDVSTETLARTTLVTSTATELWPMREKGSFARA